MTPPAPTERVRFSEMTTADLDELAALLGDPAVMSFYPAPKSRDEAMAWIQWNRANYAEYGYGLWVVRTHEGGFVGDCGLTWQQVNGTAKLEVGYHVMPAFQGAGLATEAAAACRDFARENLGADELVAIVHPDNRASARVAEKIGMHRVEEDLGGSIPVRTVFGLALRS